MDLKRLRYFCKVVESGSITQAAKALNMAQPPLSKRIQELEEELGVVLFIRTGNRIEPTEAGYHLYRRACELLRQTEDAARETIRIANRDVKVLRIGLTHLYQRWFRPLLLALYQRHPEMELSIAVSDSSYLESQLNDGLLDVALIQKPQRSEGLDIYAFEPVRLVAVISKKLLARADSTTMPYLALGQYPLALLHRAKDAGTYEQLLDLFRKGGVEPKVAMHVTQPEAILDWIESGLAVATLLPVSEVACRSLHHCHVLDVFPSPQVFFPAMVKTTITPHIPELMTLLSEGYPPALQPEPGA
ncbi:LysR family transcriptional regulator [Shimwellia blattae]|uniref:Putative transcriptional regulator n=1 Tax=Shimwellia blattae (strain ATCC 29907 / DSM 4481 / JCM 1650 / NBRC 105725 / CDC 9005-74) TaxID=630626 RepID=I2B4Z9_SHIBC|nr:LysR family transcriptional regulator [Shimwellia blattae]AFJ45603.1 putative transcriptional regulator [Shimwellia blattae DSM 4481 = NBRC 105725]GAB81458.1 putative LysR family transcriptional regulator [Shimwellia blattae DSM 4481 = NBRC 105725]VDY63085.1 Cyn operon transcriptional activator [Shimwellia blattae]VEC20272.1 Cyn operon transcriptional activator [Shimwellia blattae]